MSKGIRRLSLIAGLLLAVGIPGYYVLALAQPRNAQDFPLEIEQLRALANSLPGAKPSEVRVERVMALTFTEAMIMAGEPWKKSLMPVYSYQLVYPDSTVIVDTALSRSIAQPDFMVNDFDEAAYQRMDEAMAKATQIVITHEHMDHIGGIAAHPNMEALLPKLRLTAEQLANPKGMEPAKLSDEAMKDYHPLRYERLHALAPGVVLVKSPGHTPGSQMVYVQRADGRELLLLGDVSWRLRNVELERERPLFMTLLIGEDREAVLGQFKALHRLMRDEPQLALVPGHDGPAVRALLEAGTLVEGFKL